MGVLVSDEQDVPLDHDELVELTAHVLQNHQVHEDVEVTLLLVDRDVMVGLNKQHMGIDGPTDVLAFPMDAPGEEPMPGPSILGEVVICPVVAAEQADLDGRSISDEVRMLAVHGVLHLLGMDHANAVDEQAMFHRTDELLASFGATS